MKKNILLLGASGMAGHMAYFFLESTGLYNITNVTYRNKLTEDSLLLDITDKAATEALIRSIEPEIIINCVGILLKGSNQRPDNAIYINAYFPHLLEFLAGEINARVIHISTDCVFSGEKGNYNELDIRDADDVYGKSKGLGEIINDRDLTIRTSIVGPELKENGEGLFHWFMKQQGDINGYTNAYWSGVTTLELAKAIHIAIEQEVTGLVHLTNGMKITKFEMLQLFKKIWERNDITINAYGGKCVDKSLSRSEKFIYNVPSYEQMLLEQRNWMQEYKHLYKDIYHK